MLTRYFRNIILILLLTYSVGKVHAQETQSDLDFLKEVQAALTKGVVHDAIKMMKDSVGINIYPSFHIADDSALWPYALELYFDVRIERKEPYVLVTLNLNPSTGKWTDFSSYSVSVSLTQGQQKAVPVTVLVAAEKQLNDILANIGNLREYFAKVRDDIAETIQKLRFAMMDKYFEGKNLPLVRFYPSAEQQFGFDYPVQQEIIGKYKNFYRYDSITRVSWKALSTTKPDKINAYIHVRDTSFKTKQIRFVNRSDVKLQPFTTKNDTLVFQLTGTSKDQDDEITAEYVETDANGKERKAPVGQVKTIAYQEETNVVHIVPVNGAKYPATAQELEKYLNQVYNQAVTNWTVVFDKAITVKDWDLDEDKTLNIETSMFQRYSDEEQVFIDALEKQNGSIDSKAAYMFITDVPNNLKARGYMPLSAQFGFIFLTGVTWDTRDEINLLNTTVAHELGHGIYKLKHPWDEYGTPENKTANLLDYQNGTILWKPQWDWIHDPGLRLYMFQKAEQGAMSDNSCKLTFINNYTNCPKKYLTIENYNFNTPIPYEKNWNLGKCTPTYWIKLGDGIKMGDEYDEYGNKKNIPVLLKLNSPISLQGFTEIKTSDGMEREGIFIDKDFKKASPPIGLYEELVTKWKKKHWGASTEATLQSYQAVRALAYALLEGGELNPKKVCGLQNDVLYEVQYLSKDQRRLDIVYYNSNEIGYWLWGYVASPIFNFYLADEAQAFGMQYLDRKKYINNTHGAMIEDVPWKVKAIYEGWMYKFDTYYDAKVNFSMYTSYKIDESFLIDGLTPADVIDVMLFVYTGGTTTVTKKIAIKVGTKMLTAAVLSWQAQIIINMISGQTYEQAISNIDLDPILWDAMSSIISNNNEALVLDCIKAMVDKIQDSKEYNLTGVSKAVVFGCIAETLKNLLLEYMFKSKNGPYSKMLKAAFKNKTLKHIRQLLALNFNLTTKEIDNILKFIPSQYIDSATGKINIP